MFESILSAIAAPFIAIATLFSPAPQVVEVPVTDLDTQAEVIDLRNTIEDLERQLRNVSEYASGSYTYTDEKYGVLLGATNDIPTPVALFEDSLRSSITTTDTSFTLVSGTDVTGTSLASSTYGFIIDEGQANEEFVLADCTGTTCTNAVRGVSPVTGTSSVTALKKSHRRGASVKITDAPVIPILTSLINGGSNLPNIIKYKTDRATTTFTSDEDIVNKGYVDSVAFSGAGAVAATEGAIGYAELATQAEMAASTQNGSVGPLVLQSQYATSTGPGSGNYVVVTESGGNIDDAFLPTTIGEEITFSATTTFASTTVNGFDPLNIAHGLWYASSSATGTFSVPSGITKIKVTLVAAGGDGGAADDTDNSCGTADTCGGGGGGAGGFSYGFVDVSATTSITYHVGANAGVKTSWFGEPSSPLLQATGGSNGSTNGGGAGGTGSGGDFNGKGQGGTIGDDIGGTGGASYFGGGPVGANDGGNDAVTCGAGGSGEHADSGAGTTGGDGADGCILIEW